MLTVLNRPAERGRSQSGQMLVLALAVVTIALAGFMAAIDVGWWLRDKRDAQNDVDAIALAAAQELPDPIAAELAGEDWAVANGIDPSSEIVPADCTDGDLQGAFCLIDQNADGEYDKVRAKVSRPSNSFIARAFGVNSPTLSPSAAAAMVSVHGACVMPWGIVGEDDHIEHLYHLNTQDLYIFQNKGDFVEDSSGNFGAISIYGEGTDTYGDAIEGRCTVENNACTDSPIVYVNETLLGCTSEPGTLGSVTDKHLDIRFLDVPSPGLCDATTYQDALIFVKAGCAERLVPIAIINAFPPTGSSADLDIYGIVNFYIAGWDKSQTCFTLPDGSERCGFVWGYVIPDAPVSTAQAAFTSELIPFAPTGVALVE